MKLPFTFHGALLLLPILLPALAGFGLYFYKRLWKKPLAEKTVARFALAVSLCNSLVIFLLLFSNVTPLSAEVRLEGMTLSLCLQTDGLGSFFAGMIAVLWPLSTLYAAEYMEDDRRSLAFFLFYLLSYGVTVGICFAGSLLTMYIFYEFLTLATVPLVLHGFSAAHRHAARKYAVYSIGGASFALAGIITLLYNGYGGSFVYGGTVREAGPLWQALYILLFLGFGVKAAVFPFHGWLPTASVAPTPVTALLHAVAVVKAGVFAVMRLSYYVFDPACLRGTVAQRLPLCLVLFTVLYGAVTALRERHFKRRLAYSTVSNLSYILTGVLLLTPAGFAAGLCHMAFHAVTKICAFFCAGAVLHRSKKEYLFELDGMGAKMPKVFACFTVSALSLMGVPLFCCFVSKYRLLTAAIDEGTALSFASVAVLLTAALLCAAYMLTTVIRVFFPEKGRAKYAQEKPDGEGNGKTLDPTYRMLIPIGICALLCILLGVFPSPVTALAEQIAAGLL